MEKWSGRNTAENIVASQTLKAFNNTLNHFPRKSQPDLRQQEVFTELQNFRRKNDQWRQTHRVSKGDLTGSSWNSLHLDGFLKERGSQALSARRDQKPKQMTNGDHYFRKTPNNNNASMMGYSTTNPLTNSVDPHRLDRFCSVILNRQNAQPQNDMVVPEDSQFRFSSNSVKYKTTNPLTFQGIPKDPQKHIEAKKVRLLNLIEKQYPHGVMGLDNPDAAMRFYKPNNSQSVRVRYHQESKNSFEFTKDWSRKKRVPSPCSQVKKEMPTVSRSLRRNSNESAYQYNIISNTQPNR